MEKAGFIKIGCFVPDENYSNWLKSIKGRLKHAQIKASVRINQSMLEFYWELGTISTPYRKLLLGAPVFLKN